MDPWLNSKEFLDFHLRFWVLKFQSINSSILELFLDDFHDDS